MKKPVPSPTNLPGDDEVSQLEQADDLVSYVETLVDFQHEPENSTQELIERSEECSSTTGCQTETQTDSSKTCEDSITEYSEEWTEETESSYESTDDQYSHTSSSQDDSDELRLCSSDLDFSGVTSNPNLTFDVENTELKAWAFNTVTGVYSLTGLIYCFFLATILVFKYRVWESGFMDFLAIVMSMIFLMITTAYVALPKVVVALSRFGPTPFCYQVLKTWWTQPAPCDHELVTWAVEKRNFLDYIEYVAKEKHGLIKRKFRINRSVPIRMMEVQQRCNAFTHSPTDPLPRHAKVKPLAGGPCTHASVKSCSFHLAKWFGSVKITCIDEWFSDASTISAAVGSDPLGVIHSNAALHVPQNVIPYLTVSFTILIDLWRLNQKSFQLAHALGLSATM